MDPLVNEPVISRMKDSEIKFATDAECHSKISSDLNH